MLDKSTQVQSEMNKEEKRTTEIKSNQTEDIIPVKG